MERIGHIQLDETCIIIALTQEFGLPDDCG
jgi:hypothetical protein